MPTSLSLLALPLVDQSLHLAILSIHPSSSFHHLHYLAIQPAISHPSSILCYLTVSYELHSTFSIIICPPSAITGNSRLVMANAVPEWLCWAQKSKFKHDKLADRIEQDAEANAANAGVLERDLKDLSASHNVLHEEVTSSKESLQSLSESVTNLEKKCEIRIQRNERRMSTLELEQRNILNAVNHIIEAENEVERQRQEVANWKELLDQAAAQTNERHRREIDGLREQIKELNFTAQSQVKYKHPH